MNIEEMAKLDFERPFSLNFDLKNGLSPDYPSSKRHLSNLKNMFYDEAARAELEKTQNNPLVYEFYELGAPDNAGDIAFGTSIVYPGQVGGEYFMTKGHFHTILETGETYICLQGEGYMMQENPEGEWSALELVPGRAVYCPKRFAHRSVCTGKTPLVTFYAFRGDAGHNYGIIESLGFRKLLVEKDGKPCVIDNPKRV